jgi:predicted small secreted protein
VRTASTLVSVAVLVSGCNSLAGIGEPIDRTDASPSLDDGSPDGDALAEAAEASSGDEMVPSLDASSSDASTPIDGSTDATADAPVDGPVMPPAEAGTTTIAYRDLWTQEYNGIDTVGVQVPLFAKEHDLLLLTLYIDGLPTDFTDTASPQNQGWILLNHRASTSMSFHSWWFYKFVGPNEPKQQQFSLTQPTRIMGAIVAYAGVDESMPRDSGMIDTTIGSPCEAPSIKPMNTSGLLFLASFVHDVATKWSPVDSIRVRVGMSGFGLFIGEFTDLVDGATPTKRVTCTTASGMTGEGSVMVIGLRPASL